MISFHNLDYVRKKLGAGIGQTVKTDYQLDRRDSIPDKSKNVLSTAHSSGLFWGPPSLLSNRQFFQGVKRPKREALHLLHLVPRSRMVELNSQPPTCLAIVLIVLAQRQLYHVKGTTELTYSWIHESR
jgi:hypothetical protein